MLPVKERLFSLLPWLGAVMLVVGFATTGLLARLPSNRFSELLVLALVTWGLAHGLRRLRGVPVASGLALLWVALLPLFAGVLPVMATLLMALAVFALGQRLFPRLPMALQTLLGLLLVAGLLGWFLLLPVHHRGIYLLLCTGAILWQRTALRHAFGSTRAGWRQAIDASPRMATFAVMILGLASTGLWLPTMQYDDLSYHLRLPWQLMELGVYHPAPEHQIWALSPWLGDVTHAAAQIMAGAESRGPVNAVWLLLLGSGAWHLAAHIGAGVLLRWLSVAIVASLPMTAMLAGGMQTELPTAAALLWMCVLAAAPRDGWLGFWLALAILAGGLWAMKTLSALLTVPVLVWALARHPWPSVPGICLVLITGMLVGGASYALAAWVAGNPVLPLFNAVFQSPYFPPVNFSDARYQTGFRPGLAWDLTFHSSRYAENFDGAAGVVLVALAGCWLLALLKPATRAAVCVAAIILILPLLLTQYLRYAYPGIVLLCVVAVSAFGQQRLRRSLTALLVAVCVFNLAYQSTSFWMLRGGAVKLAIRNIGNNAPLFEAYAPERLLSAAIRAEGSGTGTVITLDSVDAFTAEFGIRGRTLSWYSPSLQAAAIAAAEDASGGRWSALLRDQQVEHVIVRTKTLTVAQQLALQSLGATLRREAGPLQWWSLSQARPEEPAQ